MVFAFIRYFVCSFQWLCGGSLSFICFGGCVVNYGVFASLRVVVASSRVVVLLHGVFCHHIGKEVE